MVWKGQTGPQQSLNCIYTVPLCCVRGFKCCPASCVQLLWSALSDLSESPLLHVLQLVSPLEPKRRGEGNAHFNQYTPYEPVYHCEALMRGYVTVRSSYLALSLGSIRFLFCRLLKRSLRILPSGCRVTALQESGGERQVQTNPCETMSLCFNSMHNSHPNYKIPFTPQRLI